MNIFRSFSLCPRTGMSLLLAWTSLHAYTTSGRHYGQQDNVIEGDKMTLLCWKGKRNWILKQ